MNTITKITKQYNKSPAWLYNKQGKARIKQIIDIYGEFNITNFTKYHKLQFELLEFIEESYNNKTLTVKLLVQILNMKGKKPEIVARNWIDRHRYKIYDDDYFFVVKTIYEFIKIKEYLTNDKIIKDK